MAKQIADNHYINVPIGIYWYLI